VEVAGDHTYVQGEMNERKEKEWSSKGIHQCPLIYTFTILVFKMRLTPVRYNDF
jgi:hypothetical protein